MKTSKFLLHWIIANAFGELVGLGFAGLVMLAMVRSAPPNPTILDALANVSSIVIFGAFEGAVVGYAQWLVLRSHIAVPKWVWVGATTLAAAIAWLLGLLPTTIVNISPMVVPSVRQLFFLSMGFGFVSGVVLASGQTWVLRRFSTAAGWWLPANGTAWAVAMPIIFFSAALPTAQTPLSVVIALLLTTVFIAGAVASAIQGPFLLMILNRLRKSVDEETHTIATAA